MQYVAMFACFVGCVQVDNVDNWPSANGVYVQDDSLEACDDTGKPRYRHVGGTSYIWSKIHNHQGAVWFGSNLICDSSAGVRLFRATSSAASPGDVPSGTWKMWYQGSRWSDIRYYPSLTVTDQCGKFNLELLLSTSKLVA